MSLDDHRPEPPNPLDAFLDRPMCELLAFVYEQPERDGGGPKGLCQLLTMTLDSGSRPLSREQLQEEIADLRNMRLPKIAAVVEEFVDQAPSELDPDVFCVWTEKPATPAMVEHWRWYARRRIERRRKRRGLTVDLAGQA
jgi:hypothetical protein